jgi:membrane fusion protein (multidrug efflux system)
MYVRVQIQQGIEKNAILVPQQAVLRDTGGQAQVYVVNAENAVEVRRITVGRVVGQRWVVTSGLQPGEKIVAEGFQKARPGSVVAPSEWKPAVAAAEAGGETAEATPATEAKAEPAAAAN